MATKLISHNMLTLDFWQENVIYEGRKLPSGSIGCAALNISDKVLERLNELCMPVNLFLGALNTLQATSEQMDAAKAAIIQMLELLRKVPPFHLLEQEYYKQGIEKVFAEDYLQNCLDYLTAIMEQRYTVGDPQYRDRTLLEKRNAICMTCGRMSSTKLRLSFEELATMFEGSDAGGAEKAYRRAVEKLTRNLVDAGVLHAVELRKKKNAATVYEYRVDYDGEWGEISFDFENGTAEIVRLADWDTVKTNKFANAAIQYILSMPQEALTKNMVVPFAI